MSIIADRWNLLGGRLGGEGRDYWVSMLFSSSHSGDDAFVLSGPAAAAWVGGCVRDWSKDGGECGGRRECRECRGMCSVAVIDRCTSNRQQTVVAGGRVDVENRRWDRPLTSLKHGEIPHAGGSRRSLKITGYRGVIRGLSGSRFPKPAINW